MREEVVLLIEGRNSADYSLQPAILKGGFRVEVFHTGNDAVEWCQNNQPGIVIFDSTFMRSSGVRTCRRLRKILDAVPILHCREHTQIDESKIEADIFLVHPFTSRKLLNRIEASMPANELEEITVRSGPFTLYQKKRSVEIANRGEHRMTPKLASLFEHFLRRPGEVIERPELMKRIWETDYFGDTRTLDVHIRWLREIIEQNPAKPVYLRTVRGLGYRFEVPPRLG